ncbi:MAG: hypothetical protein QME45_04185 [Clostridiales bacterium]|nr:hypothetical protein [Clostridiales bacterium]
MHKMLDMHLIESLKKGNIPFTELMAAYDIRVSIAYIDAAIYGFTYISRLGHIHIILNTCISHELQCMVLLHELKHVLCDCPKKSYYIGLNTQYSRLEKNADKIAGNILHYLIK